jgi:hypothetical protein
VPREVTARRHNPRLLAARDERLQCACDQCNALRRQHGMEELVWRLVDGEWIATESEPS